MTERQKLVFGNIVHIFSIVFYIVIAVLAFIIAYKDINDGRIMLAVLILLSSVPHLLIYISDRRRLSYLIIGLVGLAFGILFLATPIFTADEICMVWGCIDICRGLTEIINVAPHVRKEKKELLEIAISLGDIVVGVLLIIHMSDGLVLHLTYLGIAFILSAIKNLLEFIFAQKLKHERPHNN